MQFTLAFTIINIILSWYRIVASFLSFALKQLKQQWNSDDKKKMLSNFARVEKKRKENFYISTKVNEKEIKITFIKI